MRSDGRNLKNAFAACLAVVVALAPGAAIADHVDGTGSTDVTKVALETFQIPEVVPNTTLDVTAVVDGSNAVLVRGDHGLRATLSTNGLPSGAYSYWWHLTHPDGEVSILWAGNAIVTDGYATLNTLLPEGEENAPGAIFIGHGLQPGAASHVGVELWVRFHGPVSSDEGILREQLTLPFGNCTDERNPTPRPTDYPCWNPQRAVF